MNASEAELEPLIASLVAALRDILPHRDGGVREYQLIRELRDARLPGFPDAPLSDPLVLFQSHFLLRHALYRLRDEHLESATALLEMDALEICLKPYHPGSAELIAHDPLRGYYDDLSHLETTDPQEVEQLLASFWQQLAGAERRAAALQVLGLEEPVSFSLVQQQYRRLAMRHHPDRGGAPARCRALQEAYDVLRTTSPIADGSSSS